MNYSTRNVHTIKAVLEELDQAYVYQSILDIQIPKSETELVCNPLRKDNTPTVTFKWIDSNNGKKLIMRDWSWENYLDVFDLVQKTIPGVSSVGEAIVYIRNTYIDNLTPIQKANVAKALSTIRIKPKAVFQPKARYFDDIDLEFWEENRVTLKDMQRYNVFALERLYINNAIVYSFNGNNRAYLYKFNRNKDFIAYFPTHDRKGAFPRFRCSNAKGIIQGYEQLPQKGSSLVLTKSLKDVMALQPDFNAIAPAGENIYIPDKILDLLKERFTNLYVTMDRDRAGYRSILYYRSKGFTPLLFDKDMKKDFTDNYQEYGEEEMKRIIDLVKSKYAF